MNKEKRKHIVSAIKLCCAFAILLIIIMLFYWYKIQERANILHTYVVVSASAEEIVDSKIFDGKKVMEQTITSENSDISVIQLMFRKDDTQSIATSVMISLLDKDSGEVIQNWQIESGDIGQYQYQMLYLNKPLKYQKNKQYIIRVEADDLGSVSPAITNYEAYEKGCLTIEGTEQIGDMVLALQDDNYFLKVLYALFGLIVVVGGILIVLYHKFGKGKIQNYFLIMGVTWGSLFLFMFVPYSTPDEVAHIATVYSDVNKIMGKEVVDENGYTFVREEDAQVLRENNVSFKSIRYYYGTDHSDGSKERASYCRGPLNVPFVAHLPQTIGVAIGVISNANAVVTLYLGKFAALFFYLCCCYLAISWIPWGKMMLTVIALFPMCLELGSSFSYDCIVIALCFMFIAYTMKLIYEKECVTWKDYILLGIIAAWMAPCKVAYLFVCGLVFAIPRKKTNNSKWVWLAKTGVFCIGGILTVVRRISFLNNLVSEQPVMGQNSETGFTLSHILLNRSESLRMIITTYFEQTDLYLEEIVGGLLGPLTINISWKVIVGFIVIVVLTLLLDYGENSYMKWKDKVLSVILTLIMVGGIVLSMWLDCSTTEYPYILGVQGRYFIPVLPMVLLAVKPNVFEVKRDINHWLISAVFSWNY